MDAISVLKELAKRARQYGGSPPGGNLLPGLSDIVALRQPSHLSWLSAPRAWLPLTLR